MGGVELFGSHKSDIVLMKKNNFDVWKMPQLELIFSQ